MKPQALTTLDEALAAVLAQALPLGGRIAVGGYELTLEDVRGVEGPNYEAERGRLTARKGDRLVCNPEPERRLYLAPIGSAADIRANTNCWIPASSTMTATSMFSWSMPRHLLRIS